MLRKELWNNISNIVQIKFKQRTNVEKLTYVISVKTIEKRVEQCKRDLKKEGWKFFKSERINKITDIDCYELFFTKKLDSE